MAKGPRPVQRPLLKRTVEWPVRPACLLLQKYYKEVKECQPCAGVHYREEGPYRVVELLQKHRRHQEAVVLLHYW